MAQNQRIDQERAAQIREILANQGADAVKQRYGHNITSTAEYREAERQRRAFADMRRRVEEEARQEQEARASSQQQEHDQAQRNAIDQQRVQQEAQRQAEIERQRQEEIARQQAEAQRQHEQQVYEQEAHAEDDDHQREDAAQRAQETQQSEEQQDGESSIPFRAPEAPGGGQGAPGAGCPRARAAPGAGAEPGAFDEHVIGSSAGGIEGAQARGLRPFRRRRRSAAWRSPIGGALQEGSSPVRAPRRQS